MDKAEIQQIAAFISDVYEGICERDGTVFMQQDLNRLYGVIKRLMDATFEAKELGKKALLASLEKRARECKQHIG